MSFLGVETGSDGVFSLGLEKMIIPSILLHLAVIALIIAAPAFYFKRTYPSIYMVRLVSAPSEKPLEVGEQWINKEVGKIEPINKITSKPIRKIVKKVPIAPIKKRIIRERSFAKKVSPDKIKDIRSSRKIREAITRIKREVSGQRNQKNIVTSGVNAPQGKIDVIASETTDLRLKIYYTIIWGKIKGGWVLPEGLIKNQEGLEAIISFKILRDGKIENIRFEKPSGNSYFDKSVLRAVEKANPLPSLPGEYEGEYLDIGVRFHPSELY